MNYEINGLYKNNSGTIDGREDSFGAAAVKAIVLVGIAVAIVYGLKAIFG